MTWNYRIIKHLDTTGEYYQVHECFYGRGKWPHSWTADEISPHGTDRVELRTSFVHYINDATKKPVLIESNGKIIGEEPPLLITQATEE